jgi:hypothetical protein
MEGYGANSRVVFSKDEVERLCKRIRTSKELPESIYKEFEGKKSWANPGGKSDGLKSLIRRWYIDRE